MFQYLKATDNRVRIAVIFFRASEGVQACAVLLLLPFRCNLLYQRLKKIVAVDTTNFLYALTEVDVYVVHLVLIDVSGGHGRCRPSTGLGDSK